MAASGFLSILALSFIFAAVVEADVLCPFNPVECKTCYGNNSTATTFQYAICDTRLSAGIPSFADNFYTITDTLTVSYDVNNIGYDAFIAFAKIGTLILRQGYRSSPVQAEWDILAFNSVTITGLDVGGLDGLIPPNDGLTLLGAEGLQRLRIADCRETYVLNAKYWSEFKTLSRLEIENTSISKIDEEAFVGLENTLEYLSLNSTSISTIPTNALKNLTKLKELIVDNNPIEQLTDDSFQGLVSLERLYIQNASLTSVDLSAFNGLNALKVLFFDSNHLLTTLNVSDLSQLPKIAYISVSNTNLTILSPKFNDLLNREDFLLLDIGNSSNIVCDASIQWMAKHALCKDSKLNIGSSQCANREKSIEAYLSETVPNACEVPTTPAPTGQTTTSAKKSGSVLTASVFLTTSMIAVFTAAAKLI